MPQQVAIIAGASSGIGEAAAKELARNGYVVVLAARRENRLSALASQIQEEGGQVLVIPTDFSQVDQIQLLVDKTLQSFGQIDVLVNSAGYGKLIWLDEQSLSEIQDQIQVNLIGAIQVTREVLPSMLKAGRGQIIHITSISSWVGVPTYSIYTASKFGLRGFIESLRRELRGTGIIVSGVFPGAVDTEFVQHAGVHWEITGVTPNWLIASTEKVAQLIYKVIQKKRKNAVIPAIMWVAVLANAHFPGFVSWILSKYFYRIDGKTIAWRNREE
jgi:short-subunit dehydrogenase